MKIKTNFLEEKAQRAAIVFDLNTDGYKRMLFEHVPVGIYFYKRLGETGFLYKKLTSVSAIYNDSNILVIVNADTTVYVHKQELEE